MLDDEIRKILLDHCREFGSQRGWAASHGLSASYVSDILGGRRAPGPKILRALDITLSISTNGSVKGAT